MERKPSRKPEDSEICQVCDENLVESDAILDDPASEIDPVLRALAQKVRAGQILCDDEFRVLSDFQDDWRNSEEFAVAFGAIDRILTRED